MHGVKIIPIASAPGYSVREDGAVIGPKGHVRKLAVSNAGYLHCSLNGGKGDLSVHRAVAIAFLGAPPTEGHQVAHKDGNRQNNAASNLRWATPRENCADRLIHGAKTVKLNSDQVRVIRARLARGVKQCAIADEYGVSPNHICQIANEKRWVNLESQA